MIPADVASSLRAQLPLPQGAAQPAQTQPVAATQRLRDILSDLVPGQRILAEIQALLPNGTYRATVAQRDITLALPFSAKPGDSLELEVVDTDGKLALAFVANRGNATPEPESTSVPTTFSQTGRLIGDLLSGLNPDSQRAAPAPLNGNQPLLAAPPENTQRLAPALKEAITQSGIFYEAHQARWINGELPQSSLLQEPQGKQSTVAPTLITTTDKEAPAAPPPTAQPTSTTPAPTAPPPSSVDHNPVAITDTATQRVTTPASNIPPDLVPIVQQQLDGLATQTFVWQGQVWPGQSMEWAIEPDASPHGGEVDSVDNWRTTLRLNLPRLGEVNASLQLRSGGNLELSLAATDEASRQQLSSALASLRQHLDDAGLNLSSFKVESGSQLP